jgi:hypothetical protein
MTLVRTSINQVANAAAMQTYEANPDITSRYGMRGHARQPHQRDLSGRWMGESSPTAVAPSHRSTSAAVQRSLP